MSNRIRPHVAGALAIVVSLTLLTACMGGPEIETQTFETPDGVAVVQTAKMVATVQSVDARTRSLTLKPKHGKAQTFKADAAVANFNQIQVGDEVHAEVVEALAITLVPGGAAESAGAAEAIAVAPLGAKPGIVMVDSVQATAEIIGIDAHEHSVTLEFVDGTVRVLQVSKKRDLSSVMLGDSVQVRITEGVAIGVSKPIKK